MRKTEPSKVERLSAPNIQPVDQRCDKSLPRPKIRFTVRGYGEEFYASWQPFIDFVKKMPPADIDSSLYYFDAYHPITH